MQQIWLTELWNLNSFMYNPLFLLWTHSSESPVLCYLWMVLYKAETKTCLTEKAVVMVYTLGTLFHSESEVWQWLLADLPCHSDQVNSATLYSKCLFMMLGKSLYFPLSCHQVVEWCCKYKKLLTAKLGQGFIKSSETQVPVPNDLLNKPEACPDCLTVRYPWGTGIKGPPLIHSGHYL